MKWLHWFYRWCTPIRVFMSFVGIVFGIMNGGVGVVGAVLSGACLAGYIALYMGYSKGRYFNLYAKWMYGLTLALIWVECIAALFAYGFNFAILIGNTVFGALNHYYFHNRRYLCFGIKNDEESQVTRKLKGGLAEAPMKQSEEEQETKETEPEELEESGMILRAQQMKKTYPEVVYARTHAEFLNIRFGTNYKAWMKSRWQYDADTWVWIVRFDGKNRGGWVNRIVSYNEIWEQYVGWDTPTYKGDAKKNRIVVSVLESGRGREYHVLGKFKLDNERSTVGCHVLSRIE